MMSVDEKDKPESKEGKEEKKQEEKNDEEEGVPGQDEDGDDHSWKRPSTALAASIAAVKSIEPYMFDPESKLPEQSWVNLVPAAASACGVRLSDLLPAEHAHMLMKAYLEWRNQPMTVPHSSIVIPPKNPT